MFFSLNGLFVVKRCLENAIIGLTADWFAADTKWAKQ
jgi:hypothetical protein